MDTDTTAADIERALASGELSPSEARTLAARIGTAADRVEYGHLGVKAKTD
jgi:hypothetical protein